MNKPYKGWISPVGSLTIAQLTDDLPNDPRTGAITTFTGIVRQNSDHTDKEVIGMEVEAWDDQTTSSMDNIAERIGTKHDLLGLRIVHVEGQIGIGEPIVFIVIMSIHRQEAFLALEESINAYKQESPVWKKELYGDGTGKWIKTAT